MSSWDRSRSIPWSRAIPVAPATPSGDVENVDLLKERIWRDLSWEAAQEEKERNEQRELKLAAAKLQTYTFSTHACTKTAGRNVVAAIIHNRAELNKVSAELTVGDWILFHGIDGDGNEDPDQPIWLGRVMPNPDWSGQGVRQNETMRTEKYPMGVEVKTNEVAIYVQWYEKIDMNSDEPKYHVSRIITKPQVQSNQLLLHTGFEMRQLLEDSNPVPKSRPASERRSRVTTASAGLGEYARPRQNNQRSRESWHDKEYGIVWEMTETDRDYALGRREV